MDIRAVKRRNIARLARFKFQRLKHAPMAPTERRPPGFAKEPKRRIDTDLRFVYLNSFPFAQRPQMQKQSLFFRGLLPANTLNCSQK